jgi:hypothetical protein
MTLAAVSRLIRAVQTREDRPRPCAFGRNFTWEPVTPCTTTITLRASGANGHWTFCSNDHAAADQEVSF